MPLIFRSVNHSPDLNVTLCTQAKKTTRIGFRAVFGAPKRILIQRFIGLINIKFSELRIVKMKENCAIIEMSMKNYPCGKRDKKDFFRSGTGRAAVR